MQAPDAQPYQQRTLADIILDKIRQKQAGGGGAPEADGGGCVPSTVERLALSAMQRGEWGDVLL